MDHEFAVGYREGSEVEGVISTLHELEKELDEVKARGDEMRRRLSSLAQDEAEKVKEEVIELAQKGIEEELALVRREAEEKKRAILAESEGKVKELRARVEKASGEGISKVVKAVLGE